MPNKVKKAKNLVLRLLDGFLNPWGSSCSRQAVNKALRSVASRALFTDWRAKARGARKPLDLREAQFFIFGYE
jgi:hypothetical protein